MAPISITLLPKDPYFADLVILNWTPFFVWYAWVSEVTFFFTKQRMLSSSSMMWLQPDLKIADFRWQMMIVFW